MRHQLPPLPYDKNALEPHISRETLEYHYDRHHRAYVDKLNGLIEGGEFAEGSLEEVVLHSSGEIFNNAAQAWNHDFFWHCLSPSRGGGTPTGELGRAIEAAFNSVALFQERFSHAAEKLFGSGWIWLVRDPGGGLVIVGTHNAGTPIRSGQTALLACDVWEHAYYIDYRHSRADYLKAFWNVVNWDFAARNWSG